MIALHEKKVVDENGKEFAIQIDSDEFLKLAEYIEDLEDSLELADAIRNSEGFRLWNEFVRELTAKGHL